MEALVEGYPLVWGIHAIRACPSIRPWTAPVPLMQSQGDWLNGLMLYAFVGITYTDLFNTGAISCVFIILYYIDIYAYTHTYTHTHNYIYIYMYIHMCVRVCIYTHTQFSSSGILRKAGGGYEFKLLNSLVAHWHWFSYGGFIFFRM